MSRDVFRLLHLADATLPIGGFAHSAGLETYVQHGIVWDSSTAKEFVVAMLEHNLQYTDAAFVSLAFDTAIESDSKKLLQLDDECTAIKLPRELRQASQKMGMRFLKIFARLCQNDFVTDYLNAIQQEKAAGHYCLAFGVVARALKLTKKETLNGFYYNAASAMVTNCVKLIPLSQQHGQELLFSLYGLIEKLVQQTLQPDRDLIGLCCSGFDIRSMQHEELYSRLYMS